MSSKRQTGSSGICSFRKSRAEPNVRTRKPEDRKRLSNDARMAGSSSTTYTIASFAAMLSNVKCRHRELERRPPVFVRIGPQTAVMRFNNRTANRKPHAHAFGFASNEGFEQFLDFLGINAHTCIPNRDENLVGTQILRCNE